MTKYIKFTIGGYFDGYKTVEIFIGTKNVTYKILRNGLLECNKKKSPAVEVSDEWLKEFDVLNVFSWEKDYYNAEILDGTQWELIYKHGRRLYHGHGSNDYPENFEKFLDWLDKLIPELFFVNRRRLEKITLDYSRESAIGYTNYEQMIIDRREKTLTLDKNGYYTKSRHVYKFGENIEQIFDAAQDFFDALEVDATDENYPAQIKIELARHDGSIENIAAPYSGNFLPGISVFADKLQSFTPDLTAEIFKPAPAEVINEGKYIFCKVQFKGSYKYYSYRTEDETLAVGDVVDVPVGKNNDVTQAKIVEIAYFDEYEAPFPVDKVKMIIGKHISNEWENY